MSRVVFLLEERSAKVLHDGLLPRLFPGLAFLCVPHEGKQDLEKSIPRKLRAWREPGVRFVVVRDNDGADCLEVKRHLTEICQLSGRGDTVVRIACQELEAWYIGDMDAVAAAYGQQEIRKQAHLARFRDPDTVVQPSGALSDLVEGFHKILGARRIAQHLSRENRSLSFRMFMTSVDTLHQQLKRIPQGE